MRGCRISWIEFSFAALAVFGTGHEAPLSGSSRS